MIVVSCLMPGCPRTAAGEQRTVASYFLSRNKANRSRSPTSVGEHRTLPEQDRLNKQRTVAANTTKTYFMLMDASSERNTDRKSAMWTSAPTTNKTKHCLSETHTQDGTAKFRERWRTPKRTKQQIIQQTHLRNIANRAIAGMRGRHLLVKWFLQMRTRTKPRRDEV
jgi:hypothetical protein